jgi:hypothetical protein
MTAGKKRARKSGNSFGLSKIYYASAQGKTATSPHHINTHPQYYQVPHSRKGGAA